MKKGDQLKAFSGEYQALSEMIHRAWPQEHSGYIDFTPGYLQYIIEAPDTDKQLTLGVYRGNRLISFLLSKKKWVQINGQRYKALLNTLSTTEPGEARYFPYLKIKNQCLDQALVRGFQASYGFLDYKIKNIEIEQHFARKRHFFGITVRSFGNYVKPVKKNADPPAASAMYRIRPAQVQDAHQCTHMIEQVQQSSPQKIMEKPDARLLQYWLENKDFNFIYLFEKSGQICGFIRCEPLHYIRAREKQKVISIKQLFFVHCSLREKQELLKQFCSIVNQEEASVISIPDTGAWDTEMLKANEFIKISFKHMLRYLYLVLFESPTAEIRNDEDFYLDIV
ncbi:MAG: hypothetical protein JSV88_31910 [Candidatus Aminicenantes bacterium]|nr:MAG: hypothetical protein JSV88_31910 [Candidatus Aminicenantes bacterium]